MEDAFPAMDNNLLHLSLSSFSIIACMFSTLIFLFYYHPNGSNWLNSRRQRRKLVSQGIRGPPPSFVHGNVSQMQRILSKAKAEVPRSNGEIVGHDYTSSLFPYFEQWRKEYDMNKGRKLSSSTGLSRANKGRKGTEWRCDGEFEVGDMVYLKLRPYRQSSVALRRNLKLSPRYFGPFPIEKKISAVAYRLKLPDDSLIHPTFHVSLLKKGYGEAPIPSPLPPTVSLDGQLVVEPKSILDRRTIMRKRQRVDQLLVEWSNLAPESATWEDEAFILKQFPDFVP